MEMNRKEYVRHLMRRQRRARAKKREIEKLQAEYEKIKDLNEHIIERKMRQVRLNRLFREIEELKEISARNARNRTTLKPKPKTYEEMRYENWKRARELGQEYSKLNALINYNVYVGGLKEEQLVDESTQKLFLLEKRLSYGNEVSKSNANNKPFKPVQEKKTKSKNPGASRLHARLSYGNTHSYINVLLGLKQKNRTILSEILKEEFTTSSTENILESKVDTSSISKNKSKTTSNTKSTKEKPFKVKIKRHQDILEELEQYHRLKGKKDKSQGSDIKLATSNSQTTKADKKQMKTQSSSREVISSLNTQSQDTPKMASIEEETTTDLIATTSGEQIKQHSLTASRSNSPLHQFRQSRSSSSGSELRSLIKLSGKLKTSGENIHLLDNVDFSRKPIHKPSRLFGNLGDEILPIEVQEIRDMIRGQVNRDKVQKVAEKFVPQIRDVVNKEISLLKDLGASIIEQTPSPPPQQQPQKQKITNEGDKYLF